MGRLGWLVPVLALALVLGWTASGQSTATIRAQAGVSVSVDPSSGNLSLGERATVDVVVGGGAEDLYGAQFQLTFAPDVLQVVDDDAVVEGVQVAVGPLLSSDLVETAGPDFIVAQNSASQAQGVVTFAMAQLSPSKPADRGGVLASVTFQALAAGQSDLVLLDVVLSDSAGQVIPASPVGGGISVRSDATPAATEAPATTAPAPTNTPPPTAPAATATPPPTALPAPTSTPQPTAAPILEPTPPPPPSSGGLSGVAIAGIVAALAAAVTAFILVRRRGGQATAGPLP